MGLHICFHLRSSLPAIFLILIPVSIRTPDPKECFVPLVLSLGGRISHLWNQTRVCLRPHRAAHTLVPMCHGIPPPHSGGSLFQAKHAPGRTGSLNIQLPNCWPAPVVETTPAAAAAEMTASRSSLARKQTRVKSSQMDHFWH